jgi:hypothetical protein
VFVNVNVVPALPNAAPMSPVLAARSLVWQRPSTACSAEAFAAGDKVGNTEIARVEVAVGGGADDGLVTGVVVGNAAAEDRLLVPGHAAAIISAAEASASMAT